MRPRGATLASIWILATVIAPAQWREDGKEVPDNSWRKSAADFAAMLMVTDKPEDFFKEWYRPASPETKPKLTSASSTTRGGKVAALIVFRGCRANDKGNCDAEVDFRLLRPDKSVYAEEKGVEVWKGKRAPPLQSLQLGMGVFGLRVEPQDPLGTYLFQAVVRDKIGKIELQLTRELRVEEAAK